MKTVERSLTLARLGVLTCVDTALRSRLTHVSAQVILRYVGRLSSERKKSHRAAGTVRKKKKIHTGANGVKVCFLCLFKCA